MMLFTRPNLKGGIKGLGGVKLFWLISMRLKLVQIPTMGIIELVQYLRKRLLWQ